MSFFITGVIFTSLMVPGFISYVLLYFMDRKKENLAVMLFTAVSVFIGLTRTTTVGIALFQPDYAATVFWNKLYNTGLGLMFPLMIFFLTQVMENPGKPFRILNRWMGRLGVVITIVSLFSIWIVPDLFMVPYLPAEVPHPTQMGRGPFGPVGLLVLALSFLFFFYALGYTFFLHLKKRRAKHLNILSLGLALCILMLLIVANAEITGHYPGPFSFYAFSRLLLAFMIFSLTSVLAMTQKSIADARKVAGNQILIKKERDKLAIVAYTDEMTGLPNRQAMFRDIQKNFQENKILLILDIDNMSFINTFYGYENGDIVIKAVSDLCRKVFSLDIYRIYADIFIFFLDASIPESEVAASNLLYRIKALNLNVLGDSELTVSIGIADTYDSQDWEDWINRAKIALKAAKQTRNCFITYNSDLYRDEKRKQRIIAGMRDSLEGSGFTLNYQPVVSGNGNVIGAESLVRWTHPEFGEVSPDEFVPLAEAAGMVNRITNFVIGRSLEDLSGINRIQKDFRVSINLSGKDLIDPNLVYDIDNIFEGFEKYIENIGFEVTETELLSDWNFARNNLNKLKDRGFVISLDDFGTGFSSLSYLSILPLDKLKIDRSFISGIPGDRNHETLLNTIINLGTDLGLELIAEGVESKEQLEYLGQRGCHLFQGYYFSKPLKIEDFITWLKMN